MKRMITFILVIGLMTQCAKQQKALVIVEGVSEPQINLNGTWKVTTNPPTEFWLDTNIPSDWLDVQVPGELMMQGIAIKHDEPFVYKKQITIPADYDGKDIFLQFDGVYSFARVWVNGQSIKEHHGGFTRWMCDITSAVTAGTSACLTVEVTDRADEISYASGYAKHQIGGILRDVYLKALPKNYPEQITIVTDLDDEYKDAVLQITGNMRHSSKTGQIDIELHDMHGQQITLENKIINLSGNDTFTISNEIRNPVTWDAEHPVLYTLTVSYKEDSKPVWQKMHQIGFREIEVDGNRVLVNGSPIKLRGACRHDIHPLLGRVSTPEYELKDVLLAKEANMNFIRTSHYPPTEHFLSLCDKYGLYVEDETAVCFVGSHRTAEYTPGASESDSAFTDRYLSQLEEMITSHRNHPSIIIWSVGNENSYGTNFQKSYDWVKATDKTRPVMFSYPGHVPEGKKTFDIISMHYPGISGDMTQVGLTTEGFGHAEYPVLFDEWAHVACYCNGTVREDPNVRDFWGQSLGMMWQGVWDAEGGLGGAIWGMIDETFMLPDTIPGYNQWWGKLDKNVIPAEYTGHTVGYGEWGIIDTWRRKKPEFWNTKKAYSPVRLMKTAFMDYNTGDPITLPVKNRFDHTNLKELQIKWGYKNSEKLLAPVDVDPHQTGSMTIPLEQWEINEPITVSFYDTENKLIDKYILTREDEKKCTITAEEGGKIRVTNDDTSLNVQLASGTIVKFEKKTGLMSSIKNRDQVYTCGGPWLNLRTRGEAIIYSSHNVKIYGVNWQLKQFTHSITGDTVTITGQGDYDQIKDVTYVMTITAGGLMTIRYSMPNMPDEFIRETGVSFYFDKQVDEFSWKRNSFWSAYSENHLGRPEGRVQLYSDISNRYRSIPKKEWVDDSKSFYYNGTVDENPKYQLTNIARSTKENVQELILFVRKHDLLHVVGKGDISCRLSKHTDGISLHINNVWDYIDLSWGNYQKNIKQTGPFQGSVELVVQ